MLNATEIAKLRTHLKRDDDRLPTVFAALSDPRRCTIFRSFLTRERLCVSDVANIMNISMSLASQHLKVLETTGLLTRTREGRSTFYRPNEKDELVRSIIKAITK